MKKLSILFVAILASGLSLTSCSKDDNNSNSSTSGNIVGKWEFDKQGIAQAGQEILVDYTGNATGCSKDFIQVSADLTYTNNSYSEPAVVGEACTLNVDETSTYVKNGDNLTVTTGTGANATVETYKILILTATDLKVKAVGGDVDGFITTFKRA